MRLTVAVLCLSIVACGSKSNKSGTPGLKQGPQPVAFSDKPAGTFNATGPGQSIELTCRGTERTHTFDPRLKVGMKFVDTWVYVTNGSLNLGKKATRVIKSVSPTRADVRETRQYSFGTYEEDEICEFRPYTEGSRYLYVQCHKANERPQRPARPVPGEGPSRPQEERERCFVDYGSRKKVDEQREGGTYTFVNGAVVPAERKIEKLTADYVCQKGESGPKVFKFKVNETEISIHAVNVLRIDSQSCFAQSIYAYSEVKDEAGKLIEGSLQEIVEAPTVP